MRFMAQVVVALRADETRLPGTVRIRTLQSVRGQSTSFTSTGLSRKSQPIRRLLRRAGGYRNAQVKNDGYRTPRTQTEKASSPDHHRRHRSSIHSRRLYWCLAAQARRAERGPGNRVD